MNGDIPVAGVEVINPGSLCANTAVSIKNTSTVNVGSVVKVHIYWDNLGAPTVFEIDDLPLPGKIYNHLYPNFQTPLVKSYRIRFRAFSGETCINDTYKDITVNAAPEVLFTSIPNSCLYVPSFQLTQASETGAVPGTFAYSGLGASAAGMFNPATTGPGSFVLTYTFTSNAGCVDTAQQLIKVLQPPLPNFGFTLPVCETRSITVTDSCSSSAGTITNWLWNLGDGTASFVRTNNTAFTHTYASAGSFDITLKLVTSDGCISIVKTKQILVNPQPKAQFTFTDTACLPNAFIQFNNTSSIADGTQNQFRYLWSFGDLPSGIQNTSTDINPSHTYLQLGPFAVKLIVTSNIGCADDTTIAVNTIHARPKADFIINKPSVCLGDVVQLTDQSDFKDGTFSQWFWNWGDNVLAYDQSSSHIFASTGSYDITHYIVNSFGCRSDTASKRFEVYPFPVANAGPDQMVLEGASTRLEATASGNDLLFNWASGDYLNNTTALNPTCTPIKDITYTLTVTGRGGCPISDQVKINVLKVPAIPNTFTPNGDGINDVWEIKYLSRYPTAKVQVFTRSGQLVFESKGYTKPWDGMKNGQPLPVDTYYYIIEPESGRAPVTGYITIVK